MGPTGAGSSGKPSISSRTIRLVISRALGCFSGAFALATSNTAGNTLLALRPWCTDQRGGRTDPDPRPGSRDADGLRAAELQHPVQGTSGDGHLGRPARVGARAQRVADHPLVAGHSCLGQRATVVAGGLLPAQAPVLGDGPQVPVAPRRRGLGRPLGTASRRGGTTTAASGWRSVTAPYTSSRS